MNRPLLSINMNRKLSPGRIAVFNLLAEIPICKYNCPGCYAKKAQRNKNVVIHRLKNYMYSTMPNFEEKISEEIVKNKHKFIAIRVHEAGDFYSQEYVNKWVRIAKGFPDLLFYTYTKRMKDFDFREMMRLKNFVVIDSMKAGTFNFGNEEEVRRQAKLGLFVCPWDKKKGISCGHGCTYCLTKKAQETGVVFHKH